MPKPGQYSKSEFLIWDQMVEGSRWNLRVYCRGCLDAMSGLPRDEQPYTPLVEDITRYCLSETSLPEITALYSEQPESLALLDGVDNVPEEDKEEALSWMTGTVDCPMPGQSHRRLFAEWTGV